MILKNVETGAITQEPNPEGEGVRCLVVLISGGKKKEYIYPGRMADLEIRTTYNVVIKQGTIQRLRKLKTKS